MFTSLSLFVATSLSSNNVYLVYFLLLALQEVSELEQRMGFYFQLSTAEDLKGTILIVQNNVRWAWLNFN
jgi:hypothetical protein